MKKIYKWGKVMMIFLCIIIFLFLVTRSEREGGKYFHPSQEYNQNSDENSDENPLLLDSNQNIKNESEDIIKNSILNIKIKEKILKVEVADTPFLQEKGLSGRENLNENEGMLFVFNFLDKHGFWMKDMNFPIDIIWLDEEMKIVWIEKNVAPLSYPKIFSPKSDAKYVLEVVSGFSQKSNLQTGDLIEFLP